MAQSLSIAAKYYIRVRNTNFAIKARFDNFSNLSYSDSLVDVGSYAFSLPGTDPRISLIGLDCIIEIFRSVPGLGIDWYPAFTGLHRKPQIDMDTNGAYLFTSSGVGLKDLLARTTVNYPEATTKSYKNAAAETVMKEYVLENCGISATLVNERSSDGVLPDFTVESSNGSGKTWEGDRSQQNLLDVINEISKYSAIDFSVTYDRDINKIVFKTYTSQLGVDRTDEGLNKITGLNKYGNSPTFFSPGRGNMASGSYYYDRLVEKNVVSVLGAGDGSTRTILVRKTAAVGDSRWNRREISRSENAVVEGVEIASILETAGDETLATEKGKEIITFDPILQLSCMYHKHFDLGDRVVVNFASKTQAKKIIRIDNAISEKESIKLTYSE